MDKHYAIFDNDLIVIRVEKRSKKPKNAVLAPLDSLTGEPERFEWLQIETIAGVLTATVNQALKDQILSDEAAKKAQEEADKQADKDQRKIKRDEIKAFKKNQINGLPEIREALSDLVDMVTELDKRVFSLEIQEEENKNKNK